MTFDTISSVGIFRMSDGGYNAQTESRDDHCRVFYVHDFASLLQNIPNTTHEVQIG